MVKEESILFTLYKLACLGCINDKKLVSSKDLALLLKMSQQNASRRLIELEKLGYIERRVTNRGQYILLTQKGRDYLYKVYFDLNRCFKGEIEILMLKGRVFTGFGEGRYYVSIPYYMRKFKEVLGFEPYPGTLNLRLTPDSIKVRKMLEVMEGIGIPGYRNKFRRYGGVKCFKASIEGEIEGAVLLIERTHYGPDVIEIISPYNLREKLGLSDGSLVKVFITF